MSYLPLVLFTEVDLTERMFEIAFGTPDCPDCIGDLLEPDCHAEDCPRIGTCGQCPTNLPDGTFGYLTPYHPEPPDLYEWREGETSEARTERIARWRDRHMRHHHGAAL